MKKALSAIAIFVFFLSCGLPAAGQKNLNDKFLKAAEDGDTARVKLLLNKGADIEARGGLGETALMDAVEKGNTGLIELLLKRGANDETKSDYGVTPLMIAASWPNSEIVEFLLTKGSPLETKDMYGKTALFQAAELDHTDTVRTLLLHGAYLEARDNDGNTPLIAAACHYPADPGIKLEVVKLFMERGADIHAENKLGLTAMACARRTEAYVVADLLDSPARQRKLLDEANAKKPEERFGIYLSAFQQRPQDEFLREKIIQTVAALPTSPAIPEVARQLFVTASSQIKQTSTPAELDQPIGLLRKALEIAPWWGNAYYNLSLALEMRGQYDDAIRQLNYYLELKPPEADASRARAHLTVLQTEKDAAAGKQQ